MSAVKENMKILREETDKLCDHLDKTFFNWPLKDMAERIKKAADNLEKEIDKIAETAVPLFDPGDQKKEKSMKVTVNGIDAERDVEKEMKLIKEMIKEFDEACHSILTNPIMIEACENPYCGEALYRFYEIEEKKFCYFFKKETPKELLNFCVYEIRGRKILDCGYGSDGIFPIIKPILIKYGEALKVDDLRINKI